MLMNFDLNLLVVLHVLLEERSVTRTGERLGRTQSAISNALKRLRDHLDDPLLVRTPEGLSPTPRAVELQPMVARIVHDAGACIARPGDFDAATARAQFAIGAPDRFNLPVFLPLLEHLGRVAPGIVLNLRTTDRDYAIRLIEADEIDLAIGWFDGKPRISRAVSPSRTASSACAARITRCSNRAFAPRLRKSLGSRIWSSVPPVTAEPPLTRCWIATAMRATSRRP